MTFRKLPVGVQDVLPRECKILTDLKVRLYDKFIGSGFQPVLSAGLDYYENYRRGGAAIAETDMFKLTDTDGRLLVLRPDTTLAIAGIAATKLDALPARLCYFSDKYELQGAGGLNSREIFQAGVECLGEEGAFSDAQAIAFAIECLKETGLDDFMIDLGHVGYFKGILEESGLSAADAEAVRTYVNRKDTVNAEMVLKRSGATGDVLNNVLALPTLFGGAEVLERAQSLTENKNARAAIGRLYDIYRLLDQMGYARYICFDLGMVKSLSYYSGIVFSGLVKELGAPVLSGGRYDHLADEFGKHIPAVGFAMGLKRILVCLERKSALPEEERPCVIVADDGAEAKAYAEFLRMRKKGKRVRLSAFTGKDGLETERKNGFSVCFVEGNE